MSEYAPPNLDVTLRHIPEPQLEFGYGQATEYPRDGLYLYGPPTSEAPLLDVRYGVIGTAEGVRRFHRWAADVARFIDIPVPKEHGRDVEPQHVAFPDFEQAFGAKWPTIPTVSISDIDPKELRDTLYIAN